MGVLGLTTRQPSRRVLLLTHRVPYPPDRGDRIRSYHLLKLLSRKFEVALACVSDEEVTAEQRQVLAQLAGRLAIQRTSKLVSRARGVAALVQGQAVTPSLFFDPRLAKTIIEWHRQKPFDAVLTFCTGMIRYARLLTHPAYRPVEFARTRPIHVLDLVDVDSRKWAAYAQNTAGPMKWVYTREAERLARIESGIEDRFDRISVISEPEAETYRKYLRDHPGLAVVENGVDLDYFAPRPDVAGQTAVFVGVMNYKPNIEAVQWYAKEVWPLVRRKLPKATFKIVGKDPSPQVKALRHHPGVEVIGTVPDVRPYIEEASAVVAPLKVARGVQNKVLEAMACRRAVICSPEAANGIRALPGRHLLVAASTKAFARYTLALMRDDHYRQQVAAAARRCVQRRYGWPQALEPMIELLGGTSEEWGSITPPLAIAA
jgi:sugar transferase (PEP-CTERM/EpsH1 system associated)